MKKSSGGTEPLWDRARCLGPGVEGEPSRLTYVEVWKMRRNESMDTLVSSNKSSGKSPKGGGKPPAGPNTAHKALIARNLRLVYDEVAGEQIPDRILELLVQIDKQEGRGS